MVSQARVERKAQPSSLLVERGDVLNHASGRVFSEHAVGVERGASGAPRRNNTKESRSVSELDGREAKKVSAGCAKECGIVSYSRRTHIKLE